MIDIEDTGKAIVHASIKVHKTLGPGLLENVYQKCIAYELEVAGHEKENGQQSVAVDYNCPKGMMVLSNRSLPGVFHLADTRFDKKDLSLRPLRLCG